MERRENLTRNLALVDRDPRRRQAITFPLYAHGLHVEPFEDLAELLAHWPRSGVIMIEDAGNAVQDLIAAMTERGQWLPLVAFSDAPATQRIVRAVLDGAIDYVEWPCATEDLLGVIAAAETAGAVIGSLKLREARAKSRLQRLTRREREVLAGVTDGLSNRRIGEALAISPRTVEIHRANMLTKMGAQHTSEAIRVAIEASLVG
jgi:two-component system, LuxR family, response regulator FixJ